MKRQTLFIIIIVILLAITGFIWINFFERRSEEPSIDLRTLTPEFALQEYRKIKGLKPDVSVFTDPFFKSLQDLAPVLPRPTVIGRPNPFLPF